MTLSLIPYFMISLMIFVYLTFMILLYSAKRTQSVFNGSYSNPPRTIDKLESAARLNVVSRCATDMWHEYTISVTNNAEGLVFRESGIFNKDVALKRYEELISTYPLEKQGDRVEIRYYNMLGNRSSSSILVDSSFYTAPRKNQPSAKKGSQ